MALLAFMLGCRTITTQERAIAKTRLAADELAGRIRSNDLAIAYAATLRREERLAWLDLSRFSGEQRAAVSAAEFLRRLGDIARRYQVSVVSITPAGESASAKTASTGLVPVPVTIVGRGRFRPIVRFIQEITRQESLTGLESAQITVSSLPAVRGAALDATIHLTLYRLALSPTDAPTD
jgi:hypothetical protein